MSYTSLISREISPVLNINSQKNDLRLFQSIDTGDSFPKRQNKCQLCAIPDDHTPSDRSENDFRCDINSVDITRTVVSLEFYGFIISTVRVGARHAQAGAVIGFQAASLPRWRRKTCVDCRETECYANSQQTALQGHVYWAIKVLFTTGSRIYLQSSRDRGAGEQHGSPGGFQFIKTIHKYHFQCWVNTSNLRLNDDELASLRVELCPHGLRVSSLWHRLTHFSLLKCSLFVCFSGCSNNVPGIN